MQRKVTVVESHPVQDIPIQDMKPGDVGITVSANLTFVFTVLCGRRGDIFFVEDGDVFAKGSSRLNYSEIRVRLYSPGTQITFTV